MESLNILLIIIVIVLMGYCIHYYLAFCCNISLKGKAILITGCDTGFGNLTAKTLDKNGCIVFATCLNSETAEILNTSTSSNTIVKIMDVTNIKQIKSVYNEISKYLNDKHLPLFGIVNNAGIIEVSPFECTSIDTFNKIINVNVIGIANVIRIFLPLIRNKKYNKNLCKKKYDLFKYGLGGRIVNISSVAGFVTSPYLSAYCLSKHGVIGMSECLNYELNKMFDIWVSVILPSFNKTPLYSFGMNCAQRSKQNWNKLENSKEIIKHYNLNKFINCIQGRSKFVEFITNKNTEKVINVIICGLQSKFPLKYYYPTYSAYLLIKLKQILPYFIFDFLVSRAVMSEYC